VRVLLDTNVFIYAVGNESPYREPCREIMRLLACGELKGEASADLVQEFLHHRHRRTGDRAAAVAAARRVARAIVLHDVTSAELMRALTLFEGHGGLNARDAVFAAVALNSGVTTVISADRGFDGVSGLRRVDPLDDEEVAALCGAAAVT
jgi:predicted nucleic acid-binding protein